MQLPTIKIAAVNRKGKEVKFFTYHRTDTARKSMDRILAHGQGVHVYVNGKLTNTWKPTLWCVLVFTENAPNIVARKYIGFDMDEADACAKRWTDMGFVGLKRSCYTPETLY